MKDKKSTIGRKGMFEIVRLNPMFAILGDAGVYVDVVPTLFIIAALSGEGSGYANVKLKEIADVTGKDRKTILKHVDLLIQCRLLTRCKRGVYMCNPGIVFCGNKDRMRKASLSFNAYWEKTMREKGKNDE